MHIIEKKWTCDFMNCKYCMYLLCKIAEYLVWDHTFCGPELKQFLAINKFGLSIITTLL